LALSRDSLKNKVKVKVICLIFNSVFVVVVGGGGTEV
jgi:hypothetical protein